jgi:hypothetical protein
MNCSKCKKHKLNDGYKTCVTCRAKGMAYWERQRQAVLNLLGNKCACCGESEPEFLTVDHVNNDGYLEKSPAGNRIRGSGYYPKCIKAIQAGSKAYQLLCWNCNCARANEPDKICPCYKERQRKLLSTQPISEPTAQPGLAKVLKFPDRRTGTQLSLLDYIEQKESEAA